MRKGSRKMWWVVPCTSRKSLMTESRMDIEEILKMKLDTIKEEPEISCEENYGKLSKIHRSNSMAKKVKKIHFKVKMGEIFTPQFSLRESYVMFITGLGSKRVLNSLPQY
ncbi:hypothetical protein A4A49_49658 [Nicotiana attenuata]|uniref:Uncharacterized protein n=1 Tax=Nicotiana attenuata TaxID=49451 RepID=A0A1J6KS10_NICAT|nr:hypothetical protein A4A49_49658 [Nicotiana attenuata]